VTQASSSATDQAVIALIAGYFCRVAETVGLPRSVAQIYSALFVADGPVSFTEVIDRAALSEASASTGLRLLERMKAVERVIVPGERATYYRPELSMRRLVGGFLQESLVPGLEAGGRLLDRASEAADEQLSPCLKERLSSLHRWHDLTADLLPTLSLFDGTEILKR